MRRYPARVVPGHLQHQRPHGRDGPGSPGSAPRISPALPDQAGMAAQQRARGDDQVQLAEGGRGAAAGPARPGSPVGPRQLRGLDLALENGDLVAQDEDLSVLGAVGAGEQGKPKTRSTAR